MRVPDASRFARFVGETSENLADFLLSQPAKVAQFHDAALARVESREPAQRVIQSAEIGGAVRRRYHCLIERDRSQAAAAFEVPSGPGEIHEDASHRLRRERKKMRAALPPHVPGIDEPQVCLIDERGGVRVFCGFSRAM